jgi:hypothetical protein
MNLTKSVPQLVVSINMAQDEFDANNPVSDVGCCFTLPCLLPTWMVCLLRSRPRLLPSDRGRAVSEGARDARVRQDFGDGRQDADQRLRRGGVPREFGPSRHVLLRPPQLVHVFVV